MRMKSLIPVLLASAGTAIASSHVHAHAHRHVHEKKAVLEQEVSVTVLECWLNGRIISETECNQGISNGTLRWADDGTVYAAPTATTLLVKPSPPPAAAAAAIAPPPAPVPAKAAPKPAAIAPPAPPPAPVPVAPKPVAAPPSPPPPPPAVQAVAKPAVVAPPSSGDHSHYESQGAETPFPDGELDCSEFPSAYGALPLRWLNLGGWASVQKPNQWLPEGFADILTVTRPQCENGNCCIEGSFCSYGCGEGLLKWQWPSTHGATGQSVGGLLCKNGKLHLTNPSVRTLCASGGNDRVKVQVKNNLSQNVAICKTNYPGDEGMYIPTNALPGETHKLACPDQRTFWRTKQNAPTSAQYYINLPGYPVEKACTWGQQGDDFGNFAPANLGVSIAEDNNAYVAMLPNPNANPGLVLPYTITITGGVNACRYKNGRYFEGSDYSREMPNGCTVAASSGTLTFVLSDD